MSSIIHFLNEIDKVNNQIPYQVKVTAITFIIIAASAGVFIFNDMLKKSVFRDSYIWYYIVIMANLISITLVMTYFHYKSKETGDEGRLGRKGKKGKRGEAQNCGYCDYTLFFQKTKRFNTLCKLTNNPSDNVLELTKGKYRDFIEGDDVDYSDFINDMLLGDGLIIDNVHTTHQEFAKLVGQIMYQKEYILQLFIYYTNKQLNNVTTHTVGSISRPYPIPGHLLLGDTVAGSRDNMKLNAFLVASSGTQESMYPIKYNKLITFKAFDNESQTNKQYSIWRPVGQEVNGMDDMGDPVKHKYHAIGDVCTEGTQEPDRSMTATIHENCLDPISEDLLSLVTIYYDTESFNISLDDNPVDLASDFKINKPATTIEMCSLWRTPLNTFITNYIGSGYNFVNNTVAYNLIDGNPDKIDEFGNIEMKYKRQIISRLKEVRINRLQKLFILVNYYSHKYLNDLRYYLYRADSGYDTTETSTSKKEKKEVTKNHDKNIDYRIDGAAAAADSATTVKELLEFIEKAEEKMEEDNKLRAKRINKNPDKPHGPMKKMPQYLKNVVKKVKNGLYQIDSKLDSIETLNDLVNELFTAGINERIAIDNEGVAMGGQILGFAQEIVLYICKIIQPPSRKVFTIKEKCIGPTKIDKEKLNLTSRVEKAVGEYKKLIAQYKRDPTKYCSNWESVIKFQDMTFNKIGQHVGHIDNYMEKIDKMDLEEFTKGRLEVIVEEYEKLNNYIKGDCEF